MKKITLSFMLFVLAAATMFTSCKKDKDGDDNWYGIKATFSGSVSDNFNATAAGFKQSASESGTSVSALNQFWVPLMVIQ